VIDFLSNTEPSYKALFPVICVGISATDPTIPVGTEGIIGFTGLRILRILRILTDRILRLSLLYI